MPKLSDLIKKFFRFFLNLVYPIPIICIFAFNNDNDFKSSSSCYIYFFYIYLDENVSCFEVPPSL